MILDSLVDRFEKIANYMKILKNGVRSIYIQITKTLQSKLHNCHGVWRCCNCLKGNNHFAQLRLALHHASCTLYPVQLRNLGL